MGFGTWIDDPAAACDYLVESGTAGLDDKPYEVRRIGVETRTLMRYYWIVGFGPTTAYVVYANGQTVVFRFF